MIIWKRSTSIVFFCSLAILIKKKYFTWLRTRLYLPRLVFNNLKKLTAILARKNSMQQVFHFSRSTGSIKIFSYKNLGQNKKLPWAKVVKKNRTFCKTFLSMKKFLRMFSWWFSKIINCYQCSFTLSFSLDEENRGLEHEENNILLDTMYIVFSLKLLWMT